MTQLRRLHVDPNEAQAPPDVDHNLITVASKARVNNATALALIRDGNFADHVEGDRTEAVHAAGKGQIHDRIITTLLDEWEVYIKSPFWSDVASTHGMYSSALIDLPLNMDDIDFPIFMDEMYNITIAFPPHDTPHLIEVLTLP